MASGSREHQHEARSQVRTSVLVCTRNRAESLARTLDALCRCAPPRRSWQVVAVDNGSRDTTRSTLERFRGRLPLHVVHEPAYGLSQARNTAVAHAGGDYLLWTDDDATPSPGWLRAYESAFDAHPEAAFFGGPIRPHFQGTPPGWLLPSLPLIRNAFAGLELPGAAHLDARSPHLPYGANMALRASEARAHPFDLRLGRHPGRHFMTGEESDVLRRIADGGGTGVWLAEAPVDHWIDADRQTLAHVRHYFTGVGFVGTRRALEAGRTTGLGARLRLLRRIAWQDAVYLGARAVGRRAVWMPALREASRLRGRLRAHREVYALRPVLQAVMGEEVS
jgi:glycosyltransferase involved in cell wall biosynthesis